jgi:hypothetical protein
MKTIAALLMFGVLALASAGTSGAHGVLKPPPGEPDPARLVLRSSDLGGARVTGQRYYQDRGFVIAYSREFAAARTGATALMGVQSNAEVAQSSSAAADNVAAFRRFAASPGGRAEIKRTFASLDFASKIAVSAPRTIAGTNGADVIVSFKFLGLATQAHLAVFSRNRFLGELALVGAPGYSVPRTAVARLAQIVSHRFAAAQPPVNVSAPSVTGTAAVGQQLTATPGTWSGSPTIYRYQWGRCDVRNVCDDIQGATSASYSPSTADVGDTLRVWVTAVNVFGARNAVSAPTPVIVDVPANVTAPEITGTPTVGQTLSVTPGTWTGGEPMTFAYQWLRCDQTTTTCTQIGVGLPTYTLDVADGGSKIVVQVTARTAAGSTVVLTQPTAVISPT